MGSAAEKRSKARSPSSFSRPSYAGGRAALCSIVLLAIGSRCDNPSERSAAPRHRSSEGFAFVVETLSRGRGVPSSASRALREARKIVEAKKSSGTVMKVSEERLGIEGESRLRAEFSDARIGREVYAEISSLAEGVDLIAVKELSGER